MMKMRHLAFLVGVGGLSQMLIQRLLGIDTTMSTKSVCLTWIVVIVSSIARSYWAFHYEEAREELMEDTKGVGVGSYPGCSHGEGGVDIYLDEKRARYSPEQAEDLAAAISQAAERARRILPCGDKS